MHRLYLVRAFRRSFFGGNALMQEPSRFLEEIPSKLVTFSRQRTRSDAGSARTGARGGANGGEPASPAPASSAQLAFGQPRGTRPVIPPDDAAPADERDLPGEAPAQQLQAGDHVIHRLFGRGLVLNMTDDNGVQTAEVLFDQVGKKILDLNFARLEKITRITRLSGESS